MVTPSPPSWPPRMLRLKAWLQIGSWQATAQAASLSSQKVYLRVSIGSEPPRLPEEGEAAHFRIELPEQVGYVGGRGQVLWIDPGEADSAGRRVLGVRLRVLEVTEGSIDDLSRVGREHRPLVGHAGMTADEAQAIGAALKASYELVAWPSLAAMTGAPPPRPMAMLLARLNPEQRGSASSLLELVPLDPKTRIALMLPRQGDPLEHLRELTGLARFVYHLPDSFRPSELLQIVYRGVEAWAMDADNSRLGFELEDAHVRLARENTYLRRRAKALSGADFILGQSEALKRALADLDAMRQSDTPVHVHGETGTGKELVARALHFGGPRASSPFIAQNCAGLSEQLLESTLFGHRRGAFTGAERDHLGVFEQAHGGTLFLDEVAELSGRVQAALLRAVQSGEITALGATTSARVDVRIISATHASLREQVRLGRFRQDLFFRLVVLAVSLPPLRERRGDVPLLARHFLRLQAERHGKRFPDLAPDALRALEAHSWPGNVRELENELERAVVLADDGDNLPASALSPQVRAASRVVSALDEGARVPWGLPYDEAIGRLSAALIDRAVTEAGGVVADAARRLGIERSRLVKMRQRLALGGGPIPPAGDPSQ